jgi:hypothetical protein
MRVVFTPDLAILCQVISGLKTTEALPIAQVDPKEIENKK